MKLAIAFLLFSVVCATKKDVDSLFPLSVIHINDIHARFVAARRLNLNTFLSFDPQTGLMRQT